ncbi:MAG: hypothetical protein JWM81_621 [Candidatus Saccharibacteria bacterium]|nr:hypothetical protein [Candidatus Saccharibacteria bacterium]
MFTTFIVQPIFNLLVLIYALIPGHNFGLALILFTVIVRLLLWPLVRKQLHQTKAMQKLQPEIKKIKAATKGNRQKESQMLMELYKERNINPFGTLPTLIVQLVVLLGLYIGLQKVLRNPDNLYNFAYAPLQKLGWLQQLHGNRGLFDDTLFGIINLKRAALSSGSFYFGGLLLVIGSAVAQYLQAKQLLPKAQEKRSIRLILKEAAGGKQADQTELNAAVSRNMTFLLPGLVFLFTINLPSALSLYWFTGGVVAFIQQKIVLGRDETEMEAIADKPSTKSVKDIPEAEVVATPAPAVTTTVRAPKPKKSGAKAHKKRKR